MIIQLSSEDFGKFALSAVRYACGRTSYMPSVVKNVITDNKDYVPSEYRNRIISHISERGNSNQLGYDCDIRTWNALVNTLSNTEGEPNQYITIDYDTDTFWCFISAALRYDKIAFKPNHYMSFYLQFFMDNENNLNTKWALNYCHDITESINDEFIGPEQCYYNEPENCMKLHEFLLNLCEKFTGEIPQQLVLDR